MVSMSLAHPEFLALLLLVPLLVVSHRLFYKATKKHAIIFSNFETLKRVRKDTRMRAHLMVFASRILVFVLLILALSGPLIHYSSQRQPTDYVLAIDTSASMSATDFLPTRLESAKGFAQGFVEGLQGQTQIGVMGFSGYPEVITPLTNDSGQAVAAIDQLEIQTVSGTDIAGAIITGTNLLIGAPQGRAMILITDGSATTGQSNTDPIAQALSYARRYSVTVHALGIGVAGQAPTGYLPTLYNVTAVYDEDELTRITNETNGMLLRAETPEDIQEALSSLSQESESKNATYDPSMMLVLIALVFIFIEWAVMNSRLRIIP